MIEQFATVVATEGTTALVEARRQSACGGCEASAGCATAVLAGLFGNRPARIRVNNPIHAHAGDRVVVGLDESALPRASFLLYILPLIALFGGGLLSEWLAARLALTVTEPLAILGGLLGLSAGLLLVRRRAGRTARGNRFRAVILRRADALPVSIGNIQTGG
ncbi:MAG: SoxR reducing system RseC family protein [Candidatus Sedimenticola endophacoides]